MSLWISKKAGNLLAGSLLLVPAMYVSYLLNVAYHKTLDFDDSFMFYRYATNIRHGLGISWNLDGIHTYGETAPLWGVIVLLLSYLPTSPAHALILGSWLCGIGAFFSMAWAVARNAKSDAMQSLWRVLPMVAVPLAFSPVYEANTVTGMETMLAVTLLAVFLGLVLGWEAGEVQTQWAALTGIALFLTRPETALVVAVVPVMLVLIGWGTKRTLFVFEGLFLSGIIVDLVACKLYFGDALPLSFYMKSGHAYEGFHVPLHPLSQAFLMLANCSPFLAAIALLSRGKQWKIVASFTVPCLATFAYLCTVTQIMGWNARYYVPYFPLFVIPALIIVDRELLTLDGFHLSLQFKKRVIALGGLVTLLPLFLLLGFGKHRVRILLEATDQGLERRPYLYEPVRFETPSSQILPHTDWARNIHEIGDVLLAPLPGGVTVAASEVGYLGVANPNADIIDMEGLNDRQIAHEGFNMNDLLKRRPDIIWMPYSGYTYQRGLILTDPRLLEQYDLYSQAATYGIAIRKDSLVRPMIDRQMAIFWQDLYPASKMSDYRVSSTYWTRRRYKPDIE